MGLMAGEVEPHLGSPLKLPDGAGILVVCDDDSDTERLKTALREAGFYMECAKSVSAGCEAAKSGRFQVVVSAPLLRDGSWKRLTDIAYHYDLKFVVVLWVRRFDSAEWAEALDQGAFEVLDAACEQPKAVEVARRALWVAFLKGAGPSTTATPQKAA